MKRKHVHPMKSALRRRGITQDQVARQAKVHRTMVSKVLNKRAKSSFVDAAIRVLLEAP